MANKTSVPSTFPASAKSFWRINRYDRDHMIDGSDATDPTKIRRVLTIMLAARRGGGCEMLKVDLSQGFTSRIFRVESVHA